MDKPIRVLSIDLDFLFKDCIKYQGFQDEDLTPEQSWQLVKWKYKQNFEFDKLAFGWLLDLLKITCSNVKGIYTIEEHNEIVDVLDNKINCKLATCVNIDNHHDVTYGNEDIECTIENWVKHARYKNLILDYIWIRQDLSQCDGDMPFAFSKVNWKDVNADKVEKFDYVVICLSKYFTPIEYWYLQSEIEQYIKDLQSPKQDDENAFYLQDDEISGDLEITESKTHNVYGYDVEEEIDIYGRHWFSVERNDEKKSCLPSTVKYILKYIIDNKLNKVVFGVKKNYKTIPMIEKMVEYLLKNKYTCDLKYTKYNKYYMLTSQIVISIMVDNGEIKYENK